MSVLDPLEVYEVEVWPLPQFQKTGAIDTDAKSHLDALEDLVYQKAIAGSTFKAVLNEKDPPRSDRRRDETTIASLSTCLGRGSQDEVAP